MRRHLLDLAKPELEALLAGWGEPRFRAAQVSRWALARGVTDPEQMSDLPQALRARLTRELSLDPLPVTATVESDDGATAKVLLDLGGGDAVEAVKMDYDPDARGGRTKNRATVCVSTQVGCAMGCVFCATGQQGFTRNLTPSEILGQVLHFSRTQRITNVVFMGMGEPLANYAPTLTAIRWMIDADGMDLRARGITVSTVGLRSGIRRLAGEGLQVGLAISLHAPDDELRRRLIPTAAGTSIDDLLAAAREYIERRGRRVTFAYALLAGVNDSVAQARALAATGARDAGAREPHPVQPHRRRGPAPPHRASASAPFSASCKRPASTPRCEWSAASRSRRPVASCARRRGADGAKAAGRRER